MPVIPLNIAVESDEQTVASIRKAIESRKFAGTAQLERVAIRRWNMLFNRTPPYFVGSFVSEEGRRYLRGTIAESWWAYPSKFIVPGLLAAYAHMCMTSRQVPDPWALCLSLVVALLLYVVLTRSNSRQMRLLHEELLDVVNGRSASTPGL